MKYFRRALQVPRALPTEQRVDCWFFFCSPVAFSSLRLWRKCAISSPRGFSHFLPTFLGVDVSSNRTQIHLNVKTRLFFPSVFTVWCNMSVKPNNLSYGELYPCSVAVSGLIHAPLQSQGFAVRGGKDEAVYLSISYHILLHSST